MSGGEQQMLAIGRALMSQPKLLLLDEPSLGLAPIVIQQIFDTIEQLRAEGMTIFLVEQNANQALKLADPRLCTGKRPRGVGRYGSRIVSKRSRSLRLSGGLTPVLSGASGRLSRAPFSYRLRDKKINHEH
ncbi:LIV-I protein F [Serratia rubidaea]|uniref:LIV-I protein F n=1 Tax=Serratia rubidaea TaxID=61652 RepID=A0A4U9HA33_SERRU|nr:LIV-I protein F [Serratia rubidaea]